MSLPDIQFASSLLQSGKNEDARLMLQNLLHQIPSHVSARVLLARLLESEGEHEAALTMWKQAAFHCPGNSVVESGLRDSILRKQFGEPGELVLAASAETPGGESLRPESWVPTSKPSTAGGALSQPVPEFQDLDRLIEELESASIVPDPDIELISDSELEQDLEDVVSETLARIYANQDFFEEAIVVYKKLAVQQPERAEEYLKKASELRKRGV